MTRKKKLVLQALGFIFASGVLASLLGAFVIFAVFGRGLPDHGQLASYEPPVVTRVHAGNGALLAEFATQKRVFVPVDAIPQVVIDAFLSAEDKGFYKHFGIDVYGLGRAAITNIANMRSGKRPVGASTITQQVAKNFLLTNELSIKRKIKEAILSIRIEHAFTKDEILELYLNEIYLGLGSYGVAAASLNYFDKSLDGLTLAEAAYLAALPKAPNNYHPTRAYVAAVLRRNWVLGQMAANGYVSEAEAVAASQEPIKTRPRSGGDAADAPFYVEEVRREIARRFGESALYTGGLSIRTALDPRLQAEADRVLVQGLEALDKRQGWRGAVASLDVAAMNDEFLIALLTPWQKRLISERYTAVVTEIAPRRARIKVLEITPQVSRILNGTIPFELADWAYPPRLANGTRPNPITRLDQTLKVGDVIVVQRPNTVPDRLARYPSYKPVGDHWALGQLPAVQGGLVALDPHTGRILAMTGGYNPKETEFNRVTQAWRQPGSAFKPFVYLAALDKGYSPVTKLLDAPLVVEQGPGQPKWKPTNYTERFYGPSIMRLGIERSRNLMTARLAVKIGMPIIQDYARRFGIDDDMPAFLSMSLGAGETTLLRLTTAYGMLVNGGRYIEPSMIDRVQDRYGHAIYRHDERVCGHCQLQWEAMEEREAFAMLNTTGEVADEGTGDIISQANAESTRRIGLADLVGYDYEDTQHGANAGFGSGDGGIAFARSRDIQGLENYEGKNYASDFTTHLDIAETSEVYVNDTGYDVEDVGYGAGRSSGAGDFTYSAVGDFAIGFANDLAQGFAGDEIDEDELVVVENVTEGDTRLLPPPLADTRPRITDEASAYQMVSMLDGAVQRGTARSLRSLGFPVAGKTGTSDNNTNGWFVGFTPDLVVGVYVGYDEPRSLGEKELGSTAALPIFKAFIAKAMQNRPKVPFRRPPGVNLYTIDSATGVRARSGSQGTLLEAFKPGQEPSLPGQENQLIGGNEETNTGGGGSVAIPGLY